ncbi:APC family permease [Streptantibioticus cattleyicolor]|nr:amino acid permease [Streptantibioticus cattleyicolor]CCB72590.1 Amino acid transporter [Streptantibioticus cattleyicolor NRRL 8057 = DSM 46488]
MTNTVRDGSAGGLRRELGLREALALGVGGTVGGGIFTLVEVAAGAAGPASLIAFVLAFAASAVIALPYAELACRVPAAGGGYAVTRQVLGPTWGFAMGWIYWGGYLLASGYVTIGFGQYLHAATGVPTTAGAVALVAACTLVNLVGAKLSGRAQSVVFAVAVVGFLTFVCWGLPHVRSAVLVPFAPHGGVGVLLATPVVFLAFGGFDMVAAAGEEIRRPERNLPLAILLTLVCVLVLYLLVAFTAFGTTPAGVLRGSGAPLADAAARFGGVPARRLMLGCAALTLAATANALVMVTSRALFAMARDGLLPAALGRLRPDSRVPRPAVLVDGLLLGGVALLGSVQLAATAGGFLYVLHFFPPLLSLVRLRRAASGPAPAFRTPAPRIVLPLAFTCGAAMLVATGGRGASTGLVWLAVGAVVHWGYQGWRGRAGAAG